MCVCKQRVESCRCTFLWIKMFSARMMRTRTGARGYAPEYDAGMSEESQRNMCRGILGVDICGECDVAESGNSALNDRANATLLECFLSAYGSEDHDGNKNEITGGNR